MEDIPDEIVTLIDPERFIDSDHRKMSDSDDDSSSYASDDVDKTTGRRRLSYAELLTDLINARPNPGNGHFESIANAWYCEDCRMLLPPKDIAHVPCKVPKFVVRQDGTVVCVHAECKKLDALEYIKTVVAEVGTCKKTYWRVWSECHFLWCAACGWRYPVRDSLACRYHPEKPEYAAVGRLQGLEQPIGRYPCCGERAFRFELVKHPVGCKFRLHVPNVKNECDVRIEEVMRKHPKLIIAERLPSREDGNKTTELAGSNTDIKINNNQYWRTQMKLESICTHRPIIHLIDTTTTGHHKTKYLNKRMKNKTRELRKRTAHRQTNLNCRENNNVRKEHENDPTPLNSECEFSERTTKRAISRNSSSSPIGFIQDMQRERETVFFDKILEHYDIAAKSGHGSTVTPEPPRDKYTAIYENALTTAAAAAAVADECKKDARQRRPTKRQ